jgi:hypothetical protein
MNTQAIQILFLKDLFLSRWPMFGYLMGGLLSVMVWNAPNLDPVVMRVRFG